MNILQIISSLDLGGAEVLTTDFISNLQPEDNLNVMLIANRGGPLEKKIAQSNSKYSIIKRSKFFDFSFILKLRKIIKDNNINIIHSHHAIHSLYAIFASKNLDVKIIQSYHGIYHLKKDRIIAKIIDPFLETKIIVSDGFRKTLIDNLKVKDNFITVHNGIDAQKFKAVEANLRNELKINYDELLIGTIGNFYSKVRDNLSICKALNVLISKKYKIKFVFVGDYDKADSMLYDECYDYCKTNGLLNQVYFLGKRKDVDKILASLDIFVFSSVGDSFGVAVVEAMFAGVPTVISDIPVFNEISLQGKYSILFPIHDFQKLAEKMKYLIENKQIRDSLSVSAKSWAEENFNITCYKNKLIQIYQKILQK